MQNQTLSTHRAEQVHLALQLTQTQIAMLVQSQTQVAKATRPSIKGRTLLIKQHIYLPSDFWLHRVNDAQHLEHDPCPISCYSGVPVGKLMNSRRISMGRTSASKVRRLSLGTGAHVLILTSVLFLTQVVVCKANPSAAPAQNAGSNAAAAANPSKARSFDNADINKCVNSLLINNVITKILMLIGFD